MLSARRSVRLLPAGAAAVLLLAACGGGGNDGVDTPEEGRGGLLEATDTVAVLSAGQLDALMKAGDVDDVTGKAQCNVELVSLNYRTVGTKGEDTNASGVLLVPQGDCAGRSFPLVSYAKGTDVEKRRTLASPTQSETLLIAASLAAKGYVVVASDYLGYAKSGYSFHPYLHADSEANTMIDALRAARNAAARRGIALSGKVMLTGYSQGGHVSMAAQRAIERDHAAEFDVVAGAHLAGPYNMSGAVRYSDAVNDYQYFAPFFVTAWQKVYGTIYGSVRQAFKLPYADYIESLLPSETLTYDTLVSSGRLPGGDGVTPNQARDLIFEPAFIADSRSNDANGLYQAALQNDLLAWSPRARTLLCAGAGDPTVLQSVHQAVAQAGFTSRGLTQVTSVDVDAKVQAKYGPNGLAPTDPASQEYKDYYASYHGSAEPPFCVNEARALFDTLK